jgi:hypothetical protein
MDSITSITGGRMITTNKIIENSSIHWNAARTIIELADRTDIGGNAFDASGLSEKTSRCGKIEFCGKTNL